MSGPHLEQHSAYGPMSAGRAVRGPGEDGQPSDRFGGEGHPVNEWGWRRLRLVRGRVFRIDAFVEELRGWYLPQLKCFSVG